jgi:hypothetical protein
MSNEPNSGTHNEQNMGADEARESASGAPGAKEPHVTEQDLMDELNRVGRQARELARAAWRSEQRHQIEAELKRGINSVATNLEEGFRKVSESEQTQESLHKAQDAAESASERVRESSIGQELAAGVLNGLRLLSQQLDRLADELEPATKRSEADAEPTTDRADDDGQDIPVQRGG